LLPAYFAKPAPEPAPVSVAVKVVHPNLRDRVAYDLAVLRMSMKIIGLFPGSEWFGMEDALENFSDTLTEHLDMRREAEHLQVFRDCFVGQTDVTFPKPFHDFVSPSVLVETFEKGELISEWIPKASVAERNAVCEMGLNGFLEMLFHHNYIHADLHPGNIIVAKKPDGSPRLVFLDTGMVTVLTDQQWHNFVELYAAVVAGDGEAAAHVMIDRAPRQACTDREGFKQTITEVIDTYNNAASAENIHVGYTLMTILNAVRRYNVGIESDFASLVVSIIIVDGLGRSLEPDINLVSASRPYVVAWLLKHPSELSSLAGQISDMIPQGNERRF
jgi:aarF domain-containing kinase